MRVLFPALVLLAAALFAGSPAFEPIPVANACSCPDCDGIRDSDVILGGRITGWRLSEAVRFPELTDARPLDISLEVDRVFKGTAPRDLVLYDPTSLSIYERNGERMWMGGSGGCQAFSSDPTGAYVVVGYNTFGVNAMRLSGPLVMFRGQEPEGELYVQLMARLGERLGPPYPPAAGDSPPAAQPDASNDWMFVSAIGAGSLLITLVLLLAGPKREPRDGSLKSTRQRPNRD